MAFPQIATVGTSEETGPVTTHDAVVPSGIVSGDLLIAIVVIDKPQVINTPSGWTAIQNEQFGSAIETATWYRIATGSESDFTWTSNVGDTSNTKIFRITGWHGTTPPEAADLGETSATPDPPSLNPTGWAAEDTLWIAWFGKDAKSGTATGYPTGFDDNQATGENAAAGGPTWAYCSREENTASKDPGMFACGNEQLVVTTIAVRPAAAGGGGVVLPERSYPRGASRGVVRGAA